MEIQIDYIPCLIDQAVQVAKMISDNHDVRYEIIKKTLADTSNIDLTLSPPEQAKLIHQIIKDVSKVDDLCLAINDLSTKFALMPDLREIIAQSKNSFETIVRLVIVGNIIDFGAIRDFNLGSARERVRGFRYADRPQCA